MVVKRKTNPKIRSTKDTRPRTKYRSYLKTKYWKEVRKLILERDGYRCTVCGSKAKLRVHHLTYANIFNELMHLNELITICDSCHRKIHHLK